MSGGRVVRYRVGALSCELGSGLARPVFLRPSRGDHLLFRGSLGHRFLRDGVPDERAPESEERLSELVRFLDRKDGETFASLDPLLRCHPGAEEVDLASGGAGWPS